VPRLLARLPEPVGPKRLRNGAIKGAECRRKGVKCLRKGPRFKKGGGMLEKGPKTMKKWLHVLTCARPDSLLPDARTSPSPCDPLTSPPLPSSPPSPAPWLGWRSRASPLEVTLLACREGPDVAICRVGFWGEGVGARAPHSAPLSIPVACQAGGGLGFGVCKTAFRLVCKAHRLCGNFGRETCGCRSRPTSWPASILALAPGGNRTPPSPSPARLRV